jgi:hypothetical protein
MLAIATMTFQRHDWLSRNFVTNRAAGTATGEGYFHSHFLAKYSPSGSNVAPGAVSFSSQYFLGLYLQRTTEALQDT